MYKTAYDNNCACRNPAQKIATEIIIKIETRRRRKKLQRKLKKNHVNGGAQEITRNRVRIILYQWGNTRNYNKSSKNYVELHFISGVAQEIIKSSKKYYKIIQYQCGYTGNYNK